MLRPWDFKIILRRQSLTPVYLQIAHALIDEIRRGRLSTGAALPGTRDLARSLEVNRKTIVQAYEELAAQGWVKSEQTRGTFVSSHLPAIEQAKEPAVPLAGMPAGPTSACSGARPRFHCSCRRRTHCSSTTVLRIPAWCRSTYWPAPIGMHWCAVRAATRWLTPTRAAR